MRKVEAAVWRETVYVVCWTAVLSVLLQAVFLILGKWDLTVLFGNLWGAFASVLNFFLMGLGVQNAVAKEDPKDAKKVLQLSQSMRFLLLALFAIAGVLSPWFHTVAALVPFVFPQFGMLFRPRFGGMDKEGGA